MNSSTESMRWETKVFIFLMISSCLFTTGICAWFSSSFYLSYKTAKAIREELPPITNYNELIEDCPGIPKSWELVNENTFANNLNLWPLGSNDDAYDSTHLKMENGILQYDVSAKTGVYSTQFPGLDKSLKDFYLTAEVRKLSGAGDAQYGIVFRVLGERQMFFSIRDSGSTRVAVRDIDGEWLDPLFSGYSQYVKSHESNQLVVIAKGDTYIFCINQYIIGTVETTRFMSGKFGIGVELNAGDKAVIEFDNFNTYAPEE